MCHSNVFKCRPDGAFSIGASCPGNLDLARPISNIEIRDNTIEASPLNAIYARGVKGLDVRGNTITCYATADTNHILPASATAPAAPPAFGYAVYLDHVWDLHLGENPHACLEVAAIKKQCSKNRCDPSRRARAENHAVIHAAESAVIHSLPGRRAA